jgi:hypothetical protein
MLTTYLVTVTVTFTFLAVIWRRAEPWNLAMKVVFAVLALAGLGLIVLGP